MNKKWLTYLLAIFSISLIASMSYAQTGYKILPLDNPGAMIIRKYGGYRTTNIPFIFSVTATTSLNEGYLHIQYPEVTKALKRVAYSRLVSLNLTSNEQSRYWSSQGANNISFYARSNGQVMLRLRIRLYNSPSSAGNFLRKKKWTDYEAPFSLDGLDWKKIVIPIGGFRDKHGIPLKFSATSESRIALEIIRTYKKNNVCGSIYVDIRPISIVPNISVNLFDFEIFSTSRHQGLFFGNEATGFNFHFQVHSPEFKLNKIKIKIQDAHQGSVPFLDKVLTIPSQSNRKSFIVSFDFNRDILPGNGVYMLSVTTLASRNIALTKTFDFATLNFNEGETSTNLFGYQSSLAPTFMVNGSLIKINQETDWYNVEPTRGNYLYGKIDTLMDYYQLRNVDFLASLKYPPTWLEGCNKSQVYHKNTCGFFLKELPRNINSWNEYVEAIAEKYAGKIKYYEFWNEPNAKNHYKGNMADLVNGLKETQRVLKNISSDIQLVAPAVSGIPFKWLDEFGRAGGFKYIDIVSFHNYMQNINLVDLSKRIKRFRKLLKKYGKDGTPIWDSESAYISAPRVDGRIMGEQDVINKVMEEKKYTDKKLSHGNDLLVSWVKRAYTEDQVAENIVMQYIISFGEGISKIIYFARGYWDLFDMGQIKMQGLAYLNLKYMMSGITLENAQNISVKGDRKIEIYKFRRNNGVNRKKGELYVAWDWQKGAEKNISITKLDNNTEIQPSDIYGNNIKIDSDGRNQRILITDSPIYIETTGPIQFEAK